MKFGDPAKRSHDHRDVGAGDGRNAPARTRWARHHLVDLTLGRRAVVSAPALYDEPGVGAAVQADVPIAQDSR